MDKNNPTSEDLKEKGWNDYSTYVALCNKKSFDEFYAHNHLYMDELRGEFPEDENKLMVMEFISQDSVQKLNDFIKEKNIDKIRIFETETKVITLNEVLEKINDSGKSSLNIRESYFLDCVKYFIQEN